MADSSLTLITGGTGFIGRHVVRTLLAEGQRLRLVCLRPAKAKALFGDRVEIIAGDLRIPASLRPALRGTSLVLNLAGVYEFGPHHRRAMWQTNVLGTNHLLSECWGARVERIVHCSTAGILTPNGASPAPPVLPGRPPRGCHYKRSKWEGEQIALEWAARGLSVSIASPTALLGAEDDRPTPTGRMVVDLLKGRFPALSRTGLNVIAVADAAAGIIAIARNGAAGQRYLLADRNLWLGELLQILANAAQVKAPRRTVPWPLIAFAGALGEAWGWINPWSASRLCVETSHFAAQRQFFNGIATTESLRWTPTTPIEVAAVEAVAWLKAQRAPALSTTPPVRPKACV